MGNPSLNTLIRHSRLSGMDGDNIMNAKTGSGQANNRPDGAAGMTIVQHLHAGLINQWQRKKEVIN